MIYICGGYNKRFEIFEIILVLKKNIAENMVLGQEFVRGKGGELIFLLGVLHPVGPQNPLENIDLILYSIQF